MTGQPRRVERMASSADGWETWRFLPARGLNRFYPSGLWTVTATAKAADGSTVTRHTTFQLRRATRLTSAHVSKIRGQKAVRLSGELDRVDPAGYSDYAAFAGTKVEIMHRKPNGVVWTKVGTATTGRDGGFARVIPNRARGWWQLRFPGNKHYAPGWGPAVHIAGQKKGH
ncbi:hypothetical protein [Nonomuraea sp. NPDC050310]|uniref:hypothetical protein n=1 Tax=Nonomuraea sp. NPDC050310 TaxID=3154935 RepID=UPI0033F6AF21